MLKPRIIPCLDVKDGRVVKGVQFVDLLDAGDPVKQAEGQRKRIAKVTGQKRSEETKKLMSMKATGKPKGPMSEEQKQIRSDKQKGIAKPKGFGDKVAERMKKEFLLNNPNRRPDLQKICEHCNKTVGPSNYTRWHGNNCKLKEN